MSVKAVVSVALAMGMFSAAPVHAGGGDESWDIWEMRQILEYEWKRSRETREAAAKAKAEGRKPPPDIHPPITSYHEIPGNESPPINRPIEKR